MTAETTRMIELDTRVQARPETVFSYFIDAVKYLLWQGIAAELDPRPGGLYRVHMRDGSIARGEYLVVDPPRRVAFTWGWESNDGMPPGMSTVEVTLTPDGDGTLVQLRHSGLPSEDARAGHHAGWLYYLNRISIAGAGGDPGPDRNMEA